MPANNGGLEIGYLAGRHPGRIGWLLSPAGFRRPPSWLRYALDNGAFSAWTNQADWNPDEYLDLLKKARTCHPPAWALVPDVVADKQKTLALWDVWSDVVRQHLPGVPLAFAVQDGMQCEDVPSSAAVVFVGGSTDWKWRTLLNWCKHFPRVHVGRVNTEGKLWQAHRAGAESCDGTGWLRGDQQQLDGLRRYLEQSNVQPPQLELEYASDNL